MIRVHKKGRLGNLMFQYALSRIISESKNYATDLQLPFKNSKKCKGKRVHTPVKEFNNHRIDLAGILSDNSDYNILLNGYFQRVEYYNLYKDKIRKWFSVKEDYRKPGDNDLVIHVRGGDLYAKQGNLHQIPCPYSYYNKIISESTYDKLYIVTENKDDIIVQRIYKEYESEIISQSIIKDYYFMINASTLIMSVCTIVWWAAWLGVSKKIHFPMLGFWHPDFREDLDLIVNESRYIYHDLGIKSDWIVSDEQIEELLQ